MATGYPAKRKLSSARFSSWKLLRDGKRHHAYKTNVPYNGPACYILGISYKEARDKHTTWIGHTGNLRTRLHSHAIGNKNTREQISKSVKNGFKVWFRSCETATKGQAEDIENELRKKEWWKYSWNVQGMPF